MARSSTKADKVVALYADKIGNDKMQVPWSCNHHKGGSDIENYCEQTGEWEIVAQTYAKAHVNAKANADYIVRAVNNRERMIATISELAEALKLCLESDNLSWEAEQEAEIVYARARQVL